jgi:adenosylhomocysteine nucleosidase
MLSSSKHAFSVSNDNLKMNRQTKVDYVIFSAMPEEMEYFLEKFSTSVFTILKIGDFQFKIYEYNNHKVLIAHTGLGTTFAASIITLICCHCSPNALFMAGTSGGILKDIQLRDVVIVENAFEAEIQGAFTLLKGTPFESCLTHPVNSKAFPSMYPANPLLLKIVSEIDFSTIRVQQGTVVTSNTFPAPVEMFRQIKSLNPISIDMETSALYQIAWLLNIPAIAVRGISNILNVDGTDDNVHESDVQGSAHAASQALLQIIDAVISKGQSFNN